jgi:hypothetical protein
MTPAPTCPEVGESETIAGVTAPVEAPRTVPVAAPPGM